MSSLEIALLRSPNEICIKLEGRLKGQVNKSVPLFTEAFHQVSE